MRARMVANHCAPGEATRVYWLVGAPLVSFGLAVKGTAACEVSVVLPCES